MSYILTRARGNFRRLANSDFKRAESLARMVLPISFEHSNAALALDLETGSARSALWGRVERWAFAPGITALATDEFPLARVHDADDRQIRCNGRPDVG